MPSKTYTDKQLKEYLSNWGTINQVLVKLPEKAVAHMIKVEKKSKNRVHILQRLHQRFTRLRSDRELRELLK